MVGQVLPKDKVFARAMEQMIELEKVSHYFTGHFYVSRSYKRNRILAHVDDFLANFATILL